MNPSFFTAMVQLHSSASFLFLFSFMQAQTKMQQWVQTCDYILIILHVPALTGGNGASTIHEAEKEKKKKWTSKHREWKLGIGSTLKYRLFLYNWGQGFSYTDG